MLTPAAATVAWAECPLPGVAPALFSVPAGTPISTVVSPATPGALVRLQGQWLLRRDWERPLAPGEHLDVFIQPHGGSGRKVLATVVALAAMSWGQPWLAGTLRAGGMSTGLATFVSSAVTAVGVMIVNNALLGSPRGAAGGAGESTYSAALSGNAARLYDPIPVLYGRNKTFPPFAAQPYSEFDNETDDQYYSAALCLGMGEYDIESVTLDDTPLDHFDDVEYAVRGPGEALTLVDLHTVSAAEVADIAINAGRATPAVAACRGGYEATDIAVDITFNGLGDASGGSVTNFSVDIRIDWRPIDDWGVPLDTWTTLATETITAASTSQVRRTFSYSLGGAARPEVRLVRTTPRDDDPLVPNDAVWAGLRATLTVAAPLAEGATHLEVRMRATEQINGLTQRRLGVVSRRKLRTWNPEDGWSALMFTRNPAWALADKWTSNEYGDGLPDARCDLATLYALSLVWEERQDRCDYVFDVATDSDSADQLIARTGRARCFWRHGIRTLVRDAAAPLPVAGYTSRDIAPDGTSIEYQLDASQVPDGIVVEYWDHRSWDWRSITCPAPGVTTPARPEFMQLPGVTGAKHAEREGLYEAARRVLGRVRSTITTEMQGLLPTYGSSVIVAPALAGWSSAGDVQAWDAASGTARLSEPPRWETSGTHYITLWRPDGSVTESIEVTPGTTGTEVVLADALDFTPITDDSTRERTRYLFSSPVEQPARVHKVLGMTPQAVGDDGVLMVQLLAMMDDDDVHAADEELLPGEGETQDPIDSPNEGAYEEGDPLVPYLTARSVSDSAPAGGNVARSTLTLKTDGRLQTSRLFFGGTTTVANQWVIGSPVDPADTATLEVRAVVESGAVTSGTVGSWLAMTSDRTWYVEAGPADGVSASVRLRVEIRDAGGLVQASAKFTLTADTAEFG